MTGKIATTMPTDLNQPPWEVMVVDDDEAIRELIVSYFNGLGMLVTGAKDGRAAIATLQRSAGRFGMVVTDLNLPGADGFAVLQAAMQANNSCYVVIVTGYASLDSAIHAVRVGAYDYLTKPFSMGQLDVVLTRITDRAALERQNRDLVRAPGASAGVAGEKMVTATASLTALEQGIERLEAAVARIESRLAAGVGSPFARL
jgi:DNA-binding NtrC family response regulator